MFNEYLPPYQAAVDAGAGKRDGLLYDCQRLSRHGQQMVMTDVLRKRWALKDSWSPIIRVSMS